MLLCSFSDRCDADTYDHVIRLCLSALLHQCRVNAQTDHYVLSTDLQKRVVPQLIQRVLSLDDHRICLGNWNTAQLTSLSSVLLPTDSSEAIQAVLLDFSRTLVPEMMHSGKPGNRRNILRRWRKVWRLTQLPSALYNASLKRSPLGSLKNPKCFTAFVSVTFRGFTPPGKERSRIL